MQGPIGFRCGREAACSCRLCLCRASSAITVLKATRALPCSAARLTRAFAVSATITKRPLVTATPAFVNVLRTLPDLSVNSACRASTATPALDDPVRYAVCRNKKTPLQNPGGGSRGRKERGGKCSERTVGEKEGREREGSDGLHLTERDCAALCI